jgi:hypothetical protein
LRAAVPLPRPREHRKNKLLFPAIGKLTVELSIVSGSGQSAAFAMVILAEDLRGNLNDNALRSRV